MEPERNVCAVVVTYNRKDMLIDAIKALKEQTHPCDILVVNNGSTDGTKEMLESEEGIMTYTQENVGGAGGFFTGMKKATELGYRFVWVMDDDVIPLKDALLNLMKDYNLVSGQEEVGFVCSQVLSEDGFCANVPAIDYKANKTGYPDWAKYLSNRIMRVKMATFVSVLIPCNRILEVGLPYKEYFIWGDDSEYTQRLSSKYSCLMSGNSKIIHRRIGGSNLDIRKINDIKRIIMFRKFVRNNLNNARIYGSKRELVSYIRNYFKLAMFQLFTGNFNKSKSILMGLLEGLSFRPDVQYPRNY